MSLLIAVDYSLYEETSITGDSRLKLLWKILLANLYCTNRNVEEGDIDFWAIQPRQTNISAT